MSKLTAELRRADRRIIRPALNALARVTAALDQTVPGWSVIASIMLPVSLVAPALQSAVQSAAAASPTGQAIAGQYLASVAPLLPYGQTITGALPIGAAQNLLPLPVQQDLIRAAAETATRWASEGEAALAPVRIALAKAIDRYETTDAGLASVVEDLALEVTQGIALGLSIVSIVGPLAGIAAGGALKIAGTAVRIALEGQRAIKARQWKIAAEHAAADARARLAAEVARQEQLAASLERLAAQREAARGEAPPVASEPALEPVSEGAPGLLVAGGIGLGLLLWSFLGGGR